MKQRIKIFFSIIIIICLIIVGYFAVYYFSAQDIENIKVKGYVYDKSNKTPIENVLVTIVNERYEDDKGRTNYDEYLGKDKKVVYTDKNGYYEVEFDKSSYVYVKLFNPEYLTLEEKGKYSKKTIEFKSFIAKKKDNVLN